MLGVREIKVEKMRTYINGQHVHTAVKPEKRKKGVGIILTEEMDQRVTINRSILPYT